MKGTRRSRAAGSLYRAIDSRGQTTDYHLSAKRDAEAAKRFFRRVLVRPHRMNPRTVTVDKNAAYPKAMAEMRQDGERWHRSRLRQVKCLNNIVEQDHRNVKRQPFCYRDFGSLVSLGKYSTRRIHQVRVALRNQRDDPLAFAGVLDKTLAGIAARPTWFCGAHVNRLWSVLP
jgi:transposase-like protein